MHALHVIADDLTGACDVGAELLGLGSRVVVEPGGPARAWPDDVLVVRNTQTRTLPAPEAAAGVTGALAGSALPPDGILLKKIDTALRGALGAELAAAMAAIGAGEAFVLPAIPEVGRTTVDGIQRIGGVPVHETAFARDPQNPVRDARVAAVLAETSPLRTGHVPLAAVRDGCGPALAAALAAAPCAVVCDAETDADLDAAVAALLERPRPLVLAGSIGLAAAIVRGLGGRAAPAPVPGPEQGRGVLVVLGSAHPASRAQLGRLIDDGAELVTVVPGGDAAPAVAAARAALAVDRVAVLAAPASVTPGTSDAVLTALADATAATLDALRPRGLVLVGGETAWHVLRGIGFPPLTITGRLEPLVVRGALAAGPWRDVPVVTKGGSSGRDDVLATLVRALARGGC